MELRHLLVERKATLLERWFGAVVRTYPPDAREFLHRDDDRFANPVGSLTRRVLSGLLDGLAADDPSTACAGPLEDVLRIRAVQDFTPGAAVGIVLDLKRLLREELDEAGRRDVPAAVLAAWDESVDRLALAGFDTYVALRERVYQLRTAEWKNRMSRLIQRAGLIVGTDGADDEERAERDDADGAEAAARDPGRTSAGRSSPERRGGS